MLPQPVRILDIQQENYRTKTIVLDMVLDAYPGQFVMAWRPRFDEKPFSLVDCNPVTLMITAVGPFSNLVHEMQISEQLWIRGPFGNGYHVPTEHKRLALIGGGYGVAPLLWLAQTQLAQAESITTIIGAREGRDILYTERFEQLVPNDATDSASAGAAPNAVSLALIPTTADGSLGQRGRVTDALEPLLAAKEVDGIYACGPDGMLSALRDLGHRYNVPAQLSWEAYMRCGIGICGACEHEGKVLCLDGPVLEIGEKVA